MKFFQSIFCMVFFIANIAIANAQTWQPLSGHTQIPIWPAGKMPDASAGGFDMNFCRVQRKVS